MKKMMVIYWLMTLNFSLFGVPISKQLRDALNYGAEAKIDFFVVDDENLPVKDAVVDVGFCLHDPEYPENIVRTDKNGKCSARGKTVGEVLCEVRKEGYYVTRDKLWLGGTIEHPAEVENGKWQPFGVKCNIVLKPRKNPIKMRTYRYAKKVPMLDLQLGFDLKEGDFVKPYGKGEESDFFVTFNEVSTNSFTKYAKVRIVFTNCFDGAYLESLYSKSDFFSSYYAKTNALYEKEIVFEYDYRDPRKKIDTFVFDAKYMVFRTRSKIDEKGNLISAHYSKMYRPFMFGGGGLQFSEFWNDMPNDTNLESDKLEYQITEKRL